MAPGGQLSDHVCRFGEDAYLAAGAPDDGRTVERSASGSTSRPAPSRRAFRDPDAAHQLLPLWPSAFDRPAFRQPPPPQRLQHREAEGQLAASGVQQDVAAQAGAQQAGSP